MFYFERDINVYQSKETRATFAKSNLKKNINLFNEVLSISKKNGFEKEFIKDHKSTVSYKNLLLKTYTLSNKFEQILNNQQNVGLFLPNSIAHVTTLLSLFFINKTPAILNFSMGEKTLIDCVELAELKTIITSKEFIQNGDFSEIIIALSSYAKIIYLEDVVKDISFADKLSGLSSYQMKSQAVEKDDTILLFTSGSEDKPKGVLLGHDSIYNNTIQCLSQVIIREHDKLFSALPMFHSFGLTIGTILPLVHGIPLMLYPSPLHYKEIPELIFREQSTFLFGTSTFLEFYSKFAKPHHFNSLTSIIAGGEKLKEEVHQIYFEKYGKSIIEGYGCTELAPVISINSALNPRVGTVGKLLPELEYKLEKIEGISEGENLYIKGPNLMKGYLIHGQGYIPASEWYDTGDIVHIDDEGFLTIKSRVKRFSKIGGEMISLNTVESLAMKCFNSTNFAAISVADRRKGEKIILFTSLPSTDINERTLKKFIKLLRVSTLHMPADIIHIDELPLLGSGKTDYVGLKRKFDTELV